MTVAVRDMEVGRELAKVVANLNRLIEIEKKRAQREGVDPEYLRDNNGELIMAKLYVGKAQALHALVLLNDRGKS
jgi:hypothetical protein